MQVMLGYLPRKRDDWQRELAAKRSQYAGFVKEFVVSKPAEKTPSQGGFVDPLGALLGGSADDTSSDSAWFAAYLVHCNQHDGLP